MDEKTYQSLLNIVDYNWAEEERHWEESGKPKNHIFCDLRRAAKYLESIKSTAVWNHISVQVVKKNKCQ